MKTKWLLLLVAVALAVVAGPALAGSLAGELGVLSGGTLAGNNPATGVPWALGDTYRLAFFTSATITAESADIAEYNAWVQGLADATTAYNIGALDGATWKVIGSTDAVDARDNTSTNPTLNGTGETIFLLDGTTIIANDYADLWDGEIQNIINITEQGDVYAYWPWTGSYLDGTEAPGHPTSRGALGDGGEVGQGNSSSTTDWVWRTNTSAPRTEGQNMYALSDPLVIILAGATNPSPSNGATVPAGDVDLSWTNLDPNVGPDVYVDVWFGADPNEMTQVVTAGVNTTTKTVSAPVADTYYWQVNLYIEGSATGDPIEGRVWLFYVDDTDGDGLPDAYELLYTTPPSGTALDPNDDLEPDGLTNMQEYQIGTNPIIADTDGDTLIDGDEVAGAGARPATDPLLADTDGDGLDDAAETNTGTYVSTTDTGTDPTDVDSDGDGYSDGVETNTGIYVDDTDTGTDPTDADSDDDGAGDWYELTASFTDPTDPGDLPVVPYPLPDPDGSIGVTDKPVKVYILSGQSNMVGMGHVNGTALGTLETIAKRENKFPNLVDGAGEWTVRNDVMYRGVVTAIGNGPLTPGVMGSNIGPEMGFGQIMGYYHDEPVIVLKSSQGNRSISWDYAPPSTERFDYNGLTYGGYGDSPGTWPAGTEKPPAEPGAWYAGKQYDDCFMDEADWAPLGFEPIFNVTDILDNFAAEYPQYAAQGFEIAGYGWWQGHKDQGEPHASRYELNMVNFIKDLRLYYENRYPDNTVTDAPFVLATVAFDGGWANTSAGYLAIIDGQLAVSGEMGNYPEFADNVKTVEARGYWRDSSISPTGAGYHYNGNAETYMLVGDALGRAMMELESGSTVYSVDAGGDMITWSGEPVELDATVQEGVTVVSYAWSADPAAGVVFSDDAIEDPTVTITKATDNPSTVKLTLTVDDGINPPETDVVMIDVYDNACLAARIGLGLAEDNPTDLSGNCITDLKDLAALLADWLVDTGLTAPEPK